MRTLDSALITELGLSVRRPGYLVSIGFSTPINLSTLGQLEYNGIVWMPYDVRVSGLARTDNGGQTGELSIQNASLDIGAIVLNEGVADKSIRIWSVWAGAPDFAQLEFDGVGDDSELVGTRLTIRLVQDYRRYTYSPRRFISPESGFNTLLPAKTKITVGSQTIVLERA